MMKEWHVAKSKPQKEGWLSTSLAQLGVEVFCPRIASERRGKQTLEPLFPTYLFCRFDPDTSNWPAIRWASGLSYFLGVDGQPAHVPDELVEYVRQRATSANAASVAMRHLLPGQRVMIAHGPFAGLEGVFERHVNSTERCRILLEVVGRVSSVEIPHADLALAVAGR